MRSLKDRIPEVAVFLSVIVLLVTLLPTMAFAELSPPYDTAPYTADALGPSACRDSGGFFQCPSKGYTQLIIWIGVPGSLILDFSSPFTDGSGNDFAVRTSSDGWGPLADTVLFEFFLNQQSVGSFSASLSPDALLEFELPGDGIIANRIVITNTSDPPGTMAFIDAGVAHQAQPSDTTPPNTDIVLGPSGTVDIAPACPFFVWTGTDDDTPTAQLLYQYHLDGHDSTWSSWTSATSATYDDLPDRDYTFMVRAKDEAGNVDPTVAERFFTVDIEWTFAIITDLHIGRDYLDYGGEGWDDSGTAPANEEDYYLTNRLNATVQKIIDDLKNGEDIRFVAVLGDLSDSGERSELEKAKTILDQLNDIDFDGDGETDAHCPYIPLMGNHDLWPRKGYMEKDGEANEERADKPSPYFYEVFSEQFGVLDAYFEDWEGPEDEVYMNYAFNLRGVRFTCLDFVSRSPPPQDGIGQQHEETLVFLADQLESGMPNILLSHHSLDLVYFPLPNLVWAQIAVGKSEVMAAFAGHVHGFYDEFRPFLPHVPALQNPLFKDANTQLGDILPGLLDIPVVTTEAMMVGSNEPGKDGFIRIVEFSGKSMQNYNTFEGDDLPALNPCFMGIEWSTRFLPFVGRYWEAEFELYPFTGLTPTSWVLDPGDGSPPLTSPGDIGIDYDDDPPYYDPVEVEHRYPSEGGTYDVKFTVKYGSKEETITRTITIPRWKIDIHTLCPVDIIVTDPEGRTTSKQLSEIPGAIYYETDMDGDGDLDDIVIFSDMEVGDYHIGVVPEAGASPADTFGLGVTGEDGEVLILADNVPIGSMPSAGYSVRASGAEETRLLCFPVADTNGPYSADEGSAVALDASGSYDPDGTIVSYQWDFGDGSPFGDGQTPAHAYADSGVFAVTLKVTDDDGLTSVSTALVRVGVGVVSCDSEGNPMEQSAPGQSVYVKATGLEPNTTYLVWIQDDPAAEGDVLVPGEDPSGEQELVTTDENGNFGPVKMWGIPADAAVSYHKYDIVLDKQDDGENTGKCNSASDDMDSMAAVGFCAPVPELATLLLFGTGLFMLGGLVIWTRRRVTA